MVKGDGKEKKLRGIKAYLTVEAALVLSVVSGVIVVIIYMMFFQYNRCLMEQDVGTLLLKGFTMQIEDKEALLQELCEQEKQLNHDKYIAWERQDIAWRIGYNKIEAEQSGWMLFPFTGWHGAELKGKWDAQITYENRYVSPIEFMRAYRKIAGGK